MSQPTTSDWNWYIVKLCEALLGTINDNFIEIALCYDNNIWNIIVLLEEYNDIDLDYIDEIASDLCIYTDDIRDFLTESAIRRIECHTVIGDDHSMIINKKNCKVIFRKR